VLSNACRRFNVSCLTVFPLLAMVGSEVKHLSVENKHLESSVPRSKRSNAFPAALPLRTESVRPLHPHSLFDELSATGKSSDRLALLQYPGGLSKNLWSTTYENPSGIGRM
jgi:hypothetical protein